MYCKLMIIVKTSTFKISGTVQIVWGEKLEAITVRLWVTQPSNTQFSIGTQNKVHRILFAKS